MTIDTPAGNLELSTILDPLALPLVALAVLRISAILDVLLVSSSFHQAAIGVATIAISFLGLLVPGSFVTTGRAESLAPASGLRGFAAVYVWHGVFTADQ